MSTAPTVIKFGLRENISPVSLLAFRLWVSSLILLGIFAIFRPKVFKIDREGLYGCLLAALANSVSILGFYTALVYIDASVAIVLFSIYPLITLLLLTLKGESITRTKFLRLLLALVGIYLLVGPGGSVQIKGVLLVLSATLFFSLHLTAVQWKLQKTPAPTIAVYTIGMMGGFVGIVYLVETKSVWPDFSLVGWGVVFWTAIIATVIARVAMFAGIQRIGSGQTALLGPVQTLLTVVWAMFFLGERLGGVQLAGGVLILLSAILSFRGKKPLKT